MTQPNETAYNRSKTYGSSISLYFSSIDINIPIFPLNNLISAFVVLSLNTLLEDIKNKETLTNKEYDMLQQLVIIRTYIDLPIRNNFSDMKILTLKEYDDLDDDTKDNNNYLVKDKNKKYFKINSFKNKNSLGNKSFEINRSLNTIINIWLKFNKSGYYLTKSDRKSPMSSNGITKYLNKIFIKEFNKNISTSMLRHIQISHNNRNKPTIKEKEEKEKKIEDKFMHSKGVNELYRKID